MTIVTMIVAMFSYGSIYFSSFSQYEDEIINKIYMLGKEQAKAINRANEQITGEIGFIVKLSAFKEMNKDEISRIIGYTMSTSSKYKNMVILNTKGEVVAGYIDDAKEIIQSSYFEKTIASKVEGFNISKSQEEYFINLYLPIINNNKEVTGVMYTKISMTEAYSLIKNAKNEEGIESYIVNEEGTMVTESAFITGAIGNVKVDLENIKKSIDYSPNTTYTDYREAKVYGRYFPINSLKWTLIIESDYKYSKMKQENTKLIGQIAIALQGLIIVILQMVFKRKFNVDISEDEIKNIYSSGEIDVSSVENIVDKSLDSKEESSNKKHDEKVKGGD